jgi:hypothetical protein
MKWRQRTIDDVADMICGNGEGVPFTYRSSSFITRFFRDADTDFAHDGSTRAAWVSGVLEEILARTASRCTNATVDILSGHRNANGYW